MPKKESASAQRTRSIAFIALSVALLAVSAWITVPLGPVPFTLQTFVEVFVLLALRPKEAVSASAIYLLMGAIGLPVFSSMRGGIGVILGPTGGFLWGFLLGTIAALAFLKVMKKRSIVLEYAAAIVFLAVCYLCGWAQLAFGTGMGAEAAFAAGVAPFVVIDLIKIAFAVPVARAVRKAVGSGEDAPAKAA